MQALRQSLPRPDTGSAAETGPRARIHDRAESSAPRDTAREPAAEVERVRNEEEMERIRQLARLAFAAGAVS
jgi:hypothetical protein